MKKHFVPFLAAVCGWGIMRPLFPGSAPDNRVLFGSLVASLAFLIAGFVIWVAPHLPAPKPLTPEQIEYRRWVASWTPPPASVYRPDPYVEHQRHLQEQARYYWLAGDRDIPPGDWYAH